MAFTAAGLVFALSPLMILLFAAEMCTVESLYSMHSLTEDTVGKAIVYVVFKLPCSILFPVFLGALGTTIVAVLDTLSIICVIRESAKI